MVQCSTVQYQWGWVDPDVNNFEHIFSGGHQISLAGVGSEGLMSGGLRTRGRPVSDIKEWGRAVRSVQ